MGGVSTGREKHTDRMDRDFGSKPGAGGLLSNSDANVDRRERLRQLALETVDLTKDQYFMRNHLGQYECKLCRTLHTNEGNYLAHTQGKRHQLNLARRAAEEARITGSSSIAPEAPTTVRPVRKTPKIGRPGYRVTKQKDHEHNEKSLLFHMYYPDIEEGVLPRHRFMSCFEQRLEPPDKRFQYLIFAAEPYENVGFKIPNMEINKEEDRLFSFWDRDNRVYTLQLFFRERERSGFTLPAPPPPPTSESGAPGVGSSSSSASLLPPPPPPPPGL